MYLLVINCNKVYIIAPNYGKDVLDIVCFDMRYQGRLIQIEI